MEQKYTPEMEGPEEFDGKPGEDWIESFPTNSLKALNNKFVTAGKNNLHPREIFTHQQVINELKRRGKW